MDTFYHTNWYMEVQVFISTCNTYFQPLKSTITFANAIFFTTSFQRYADATMYNLDDWCGEWSLWNCFIQVVVYQLSWQREIRRNVPSRDNQNKHMAILNCHFIPEA